MSPRRQFFALSHRDDCRAARHRYALSYALSMFVHAALFALFIVAALTPQSGSSARPDEAVAISGVIRTSVASVLPRRAFAPATPLGVPSARPMSRGAPVQPSALPSLPLARTQRPLPRPKNPLRPTRPHVARSALRRPELARIVASAPPQASRIVLLAPIVPAPPTLEPSPVPTLAPTLPPAPSPQAATPQPSISPQRVVATSLSTPLPVPPTPGPTPVVTVSPTRAPPAPAAAQPSTPTAPPLLPTVVPLAHSATPVAPTAAPTIVARPRMLPSAVPRVPAPTAAPPTASATQGAAATRPAERLTPVPFRTPGEARTALPAGRPSARAQAGTAIATASSHPGGAVAAEVANSGRPAQRAGSGVVAYATPGKNGAFGNSPAENLNHRLAGLLPAGNAVTYSQKHYVNDIGAAIEAAKTAAYAQVAPPQSVLDRALFVIKQRGDVLDAGPTIVYVLKKQRIFGFEICTGWKIAYPPGGGPPQGGYSVSPCSGEQFIPSGGLPTLPPKHPSTTAM